MPDQKDDPRGIPDNTRLFRRINPKFLVKDSNLGRTRPTSQNFVDSSNGTPMSVFAENIAKAYGEEPTDFLQGRWATWFLAAITAGQARALGLEVYPDAETQDPSEKFKSHASVRGEKRKAKKTLAEQAEWVVSPDS